MYKILIVEDDLQIRELMAKRLEDSNFNVKEAGTVLESLESLRVELPDVIILDVMLPGILGTTFCGDLKNIEQYQSIPVIFISGKGEEAIKEMNHNVWADAYLRKPFEPNELLEKVNSVLCN